MEAILCLRRHPVTASTFLFTSNVSNPSTISRHVSFRHSSLLFTSSRHQQGISHGHTSPAINRRNNGEEDNKPKATVGVALALACVLGIISCSCSMYPRAMATVTLRLPQPEEPDQDPIPRGKIALGSFLRIMPEIISSKDPFFHSIFHRSKKQHEVGEFKPIKNEALKLLRSGKFDAAKAMVTKKLETYKKDKKDKKSEMIFMLEMFMVEILIIEGQFEEALRRQFIADIPSQEKGTNPADFRISLYKAILLTMSNNDDDNKKAKEWWDKFMKNL